MVGHAAYVLKGRAGCRAALQHLAQHVLRIGRDANVLEEGRVLLKGQRGVSQQHAHHISLSGIFAEQSLTCSTETPVLEHIIRYSKRA